MNLLMGVASESRLIFSLPSTLVDNHTPDNEDISQKVNCNLHWAGTLSLWIAYI